MDSASMDVKFTGGVARSQAHRFSRLCRWRSCYACRLRSAARTQLESWSRRGRRVSLQLMSHGLCGSYSNKPDRTIVGSEEARLRASLRPPPKLHVRFSRMQLSRRHLTNALLSAHFRLADHSPRTSSFALHNTISGPDGHISAFWFVRVKTQDLKCLLRCRGRAGERFPTFPQSSAVRVLGSRVHRFSFGRCSQIAGSRRRKLAALRQKMSRFCSSVTKSADSMPAMAIPMASGHTT